MTADGIQLPEMKKVGNMARQASVRNL